MQKGRVESENEKHEKVFEFSDSFLLLGQNIEKSLKEITENFSDALENISKCNAEIVDYDSSMKEMNDLMKATNENIIEYKATLKEIVGENASKSNEQVVVNSPNLQYIIDEVANIVSKNLSSDVRGNLDEKFSGAGRVSKHIAEAIEEQLGQTQSALKEFYRTCTTGTEKIHYGEMTVLRVMKTLDFLDKLSNKTREQLIQKSISVEELTIGDKVECQHYSNFIKDMFVKLEKKREEDFKDLRELILRKSDTEATKEINEEKIDNKKSTEKDSKKEVKGTDERNKIFQYVFHRQRDSGKI